MICPAINDNSFARSVIIHLDCQAQTLGSAGYAGLSTSIGALLIASLTLVVALYGYGLLLGRKPSFEQLSLYIVRIGFALMLATSWPAFSTLVYTVTLSEPAALAGQIESGVGTAQSNLDLASSVQALDDQIDEFAQRGSGVISPLDAGQVSGGADRRIEPVRDWSMAAAARIILLGSTIGGTAMVRFLEGILLALGPIFAIALLFEATRGLFIGWVRGLLACLTGSLAMIILVRGETVLLGPWLAQILVYRRAEIATPAVPVELLALCLVFAVALFGLLFAIGAIAWSLALPDLTRIQNLVMRSFSENGARAHVQSTPAPTTMTSAQSHAMDISRSITALHERQVTGARGAQINMAERREVSAHAAIAPLHYGQNATRSTTLKKVGTTINMRKTI